MKKTVIAILAAILICVIAVCPAFAEETAPADTKQDEGFVVDGNGDVPEMPDGQGGMQQPGEIPSGGMGDIVNPMAMGGDNANVNAGNPSLGWIIAVIAESAVIGGLVTFIVVDKLVKKKKD